MAPKAPTIHSIIARNRAHLSEDTVSKLETDAQYQHSVRGTCARITDICEDADKPSAGPDPWTKEYWRQAWKMQQGRAGKYNAAAERFMEREAEETESGTRSQEWRDRFDAVAEKMGLWAAKMREILREEGIRELVAEAEQREGGEAAEDV